MTAGLDHAWLPRTTCLSECVEPRGPARPAGRLRIAGRLGTAGTTLLALPLLALPLPGRPAAQRLFCRTVLQCLGVRVVRSGDPVRNIRGVLVVSNHVSWLDVFAIGAVLPGAYVARADLVGWPAVGLASRAIDVIPIERRSLRRLPAVVTAVTHRLSRGRTVVAFPEGTTFCGPHHGRFRPAVFQAAVDAGRPVQPVRLGYRDADGLPRTLTAFLGGDSLWVSLKRTLRARGTVVDVAVGSLQLPGADRRELAARCEAVVRAL